MAKAIVSASKATVNASKRQENPKPTIAKSKTEMGANIVMGEYFCLKERQPRPVTLNFLKVLADKLIEWVDNEEILSVTEFFGFAKIGSGTFYEYLDRCPELKRAHAYALDVVGSRRETGAMRRKLDTNAVWKCQYQYGKQYRDAMEFAAKLAKKDDDQDAGGTKIVVIEKIVTDKSMERHITKGE